jgi:hypothetical protein
MACFVHFSQSVIVNFIFQLEIVIDALCNDIHLHIIIIIIRNSILATKSLLWHCNFHLWRGSALNVFSKKGQRDEGHLPTPNIWTLCLKLISYLCLSKNCNVYIMCCASVGCCLCGFLMIPLCRILMKSMTVHQDAYNCDKFMKIK